MDSYVWLIGRCGKKKEQEFRQAAQTGGIAMARCRNLQDLVLHLRCAHFPSFLVCGPDVQNFRTSPETPLPVFRTDDGLLLKYLADGPEPDPDPDLTHAPASKQLPSRRAGTVSRGGSRKKTKRAV